MPILQLVRNYGKKVKVLLLHYLNVKQVFPFESLLNYITSQKFHGQKIGPKNIDSNNFQHIHIHTKIHTSRRFLGRLTLTEVDV